ncbi:MAG: preprotein translocase subunit SecG [Planctomycetes bacterium]|nr:preprotein translocase subunit SecG [Planctomycetota bacterium]
MANLEFDMDFMLLGILSWWKLTLAFFFTVVCIVLIVLVLLQKGRGGGLSAAFGGAGGQSAFGSKTGDVFTWATIVVVGVFLVFAMILTVVYKPDLSSDLIQATPQAGSVPGTDATTGSAGPTSAPGSTTGTTGFIPPVTPPGAGSTTGTTGNR